MNLPHALNGGKAVMTTSLSHDMDAFKDAIGLALWKMTSSRNLRIIEVIEKPLDRACMN
jgi:hypothetical protein